MAEAQIPDGWEDILDPGERILWQGRPEARFYWEDLIDSRAIMGGLFILFGLFWFLRTGADLLLGNFAGDLMGYIVPLFGLVFALAGLNLILGRQLREYLLLKRSFYTLTTRHAFVATEVRGQRKLERFILGPSLIPALEEGDPGSVWFSDRDLSGQWRSYGMGQHIGVPPFAGRRGFARIRDARKVYRLILDHTPPPVTP